LPTARQIRSSKRTKSPRRLATKRAIVSKSALSNAFLTFTQAAASLERSYVQLQQEVGRLRAELEAKNADLQQSLEDNRRVRTFLADVVEGLPCGVIVTDADNTPRMINSAARELLVVPREWSCEQSPMPQIVAEVLASFSGNDSSTSAEFRPSSLPANRIIGINRQRLEGISEKGPSTIWILRDLTDERRIQAERESARRSHALAEIATILAHEIRNPLGSMELFVGLLSQATAHMPEAREWSMHLQAGLRSLSATVNNVLQFHGQGTRRNSTFSLDAVLQESLDFLRPLAKREHIEVSVANTASEARIAGDAQQLRQVFLNIVLNAFRAMPEGGSLTVRVQQIQRDAANFAQIDFADSGKGIQPEVRDKLFEPGISSTPGSAGLGLSVSKKIVEQHRGQISVLESDKPGATFRVALPLAGAEA
jgi:two-component system, sensor histidine kinase FlrB